MNKNDEERIAAKLARFMAMLCVRNTQLETLHAGPAPVTRTGDFSDVFVVDADGRRMPWTEVSRIDDARFLCFDHAAVAPFDTVVRLKGGSGSRALPPGAHTPD